MNYENYQVVSTGATIAECTKDYVDTLKMNNIKIDVDINEIENATSNTDEPEKEETPLLAQDGVIDDIRTAVISGDSVYYISLENDEGYFSIKASDEESVVILNTGDTVKISYEEKADAGISEAKEIVKLTVA